MDPIIRTRCKVGHLLLTDKAVIIERSGIAAVRESLPRANILSVDFVQVYPPVFGKGGAANLTFHHAGGALVAETVNPKDAKAIMEALGF